MKAAFKKINVERLSTYLDLNGELLESFAMHPIINAKRKRS